MVYASEYDVSSLSSFFVVPLYFLFFLRRISSVVAAVIFGLLVISLGLSVCAFVSLRISYSMATVPF